MEPNDTERRDLADRVTHERRSRYGTRLAAYSLAKVNSATWAKVENGEPVSERSLIAVVKFLWPETGGDWRRIKPPLGGQSNALRDLVLEEPTISDEARAAILSILDAEGPTPPPDAGQHERGVS